METIKATFFGNFIMKVTLVFSSMITLLTGVFCKFFLGGEEGLLIFYTMIVMVVLQIPTCIYLLKRISKERDFIINKEIVIQNNNIICNRNDIVSITRKNFIKTEIKYLKDNEEKSIFITVSKNKLKEIKTILSIYE